MDIILADFISLDGVVQAPGGPEEDTTGGFAHGGWSMPYFDPEAMGPVLGATMERTEALLFGRGTWQTMAGAWPDRAGDPFADTMNAIRKYVLSRTLSQDDLTWENSTLLDPADGIGAVRELRERDGGAIQVMGNPGVAAQLLAADLVDEMVLMIEPIILGGGKRPFADDGQARGFTLAESVVASTGVVICRYERAADQSGGMNSGTCRSGGIGSGWSR